MRTKSELLFERFCQERDIDLSRIPESDVQTADYEMILSSGPILVEVKQLEPNATDVEKLAKLARGEVAVGWVDMGRARRPITKAVKEQIRSHAKGKMPAIVVLYDNVPFSRSLHPYNIAVVLHGLEQVHYSVSANPAESPIYTGMSRGGNRAVSETHNTTLSGIGVLYQAEPDSSPRLTLFHNKYAAIPLLPEACAEAGFRHFYFIDGKGTGTGEWVEGGGSA